MAKRVYSESVKKWAIGSGVSGATIIGLIFLYLSLTGAITITGYSGNQVCAGTSEDPCYAYINFTANEDIFLYPTGYDPWGRNTTFAFSPGVESWKLQRSWGSGWRDIPLNETCTGTWCGAPNSDGVSYSYVFREGKDYQFRIVAYKNNPNDLIEWSVVYDDKEYLDPAWEPVGSWANNQFYTVSENITVDSGVINKYYSPIYGEVVSRVSLNLNNSDGYLDNKKVNITIAYPKGQDFIDLDVSAIINENNEEVQKESLKTKSEVQEVPFIESSKMQKEEKVIDKNDKYSEVENKLNSVSDSYNKELITISKLKDYELKTFEVDLGEEDGYKIRAFISSEYGLNENLYIYVEGSFAGGAGTSEDPYQIETWAQLAEVNDYLSSSFILNNNLSSSDTGYNAYASSSANGGAGWIPLGNYSATLFTGTFDGAHNAINDLYISSAGYIALFGGANGPVIQDLKVFDADITSTDSGAAILIGRVGTSGPRIDNVSVSGTVDGTAYVGSIIGISTNIDGCYLNQTSARVDLTASSNYCGGLLGQLVRNSGSDLSYFDNCYWEGDIVSSGSYVAGFLGGATQGYITNSYAAGDTDGSATVNCFLGYINTPPTVSNSFYDSTLCDESDSYATAKTTTQMKTKSTFTGAGWDITDLGSQTNEIWVIDDGNDYPRLTWEFILPLEHNYTLDITDPTTGDPESVTDGDNITITFNFTKDETEEITSDVSIGSVLIGGEEATIISSGSAPTLAQIDYEDFEGYSEGTQPNPIGNWTQATFDTDDWYVYTGNGQSSNTGPTADYDGYYAMVETSSGNCNDPDTAVLYRSPAIDFDSYNSVNVSFAYNMYGSTMGTLHIKENSTGSWISRWNETGDQGTSWYTEDLELTGLSGIGNIAIWMDCGASYTSDAAVDSVNITGMAGGQTQEYAYISGVGWQVNVTAPSGLSGYQNLFLNATYNGLKTRNETESNSVIYGGADLNFSIWTGSIWDNAYDYWMEFRCTATQTECEPTNQNAGSSQSIYQVCNNGTTEATSVSLYMDAVCTNIDLLCDDDYTYAGATTLSTSPQQIHGGLAVDACIPISCWADYSNPTAGCYFDVNATIV